MRYTILGAPVGELLVARDEGGIREIRFVRHVAAEVPIDWTRSDRAFNDIASQLREYFDGTRREFDLPLAPKGTMFQIKVWTALRDIPWGKTESYSQVARRIGKPRSYRAIGAANGRNPLPIVIPCHRVIGADGTLTGYGGGVEIKRWLLEHEEGDPGAEMRKRQKTLFSELTI